MTLSEKLNNEVIEEITKVILKFCQTLSQKEYYPYQYEIAKTLISNVLAQTMEHPSVLLSRQSGKDIKITIPLLTPRGWVTVGDITTDDFVFHPSGKPIKVISKSEVFNDHTCYKVTTTDGRVLEVGEDHLWTVFDTRYRKEITLSTKEMLATGLSRYANTEIRKVVTNGKQYKTREYRYHLPTQYAINLPDKELTIDPYLLGVWLGDGSKGSNSIASHKDDLYNLIDLANKLEYEYSIYWQKESTALIRFKKRNNISFLSELKELDVYRNKHIPSSYLLSGNSQREALLQGLIDSDGFIDERKSTVEFCNMNKDLAEGVLFLARSLGWRATIKEGRAKLNGKDCGTKYRVCFHVTKEDKYCPSRLKRKKDLIKDGEGNKGRKVVSIKSIELVDTVETQCIQVDSPDGLYLAGKDLMVTHNSVIAGEVAAGLLVCLPELAEVYGDQFKFYDEESEQWVYPVKRFATNCKGQGTGGIRIGVYAPKEQQAQIIYGIVRGILEGERGREVLREMGITVTASRGDTFSISNNSMIICETASETANIESATHDLVIIDEAQDVSGKVIGKSISPMLANTGGNMMYIGTCGTTIDDFYKRIQLNKNAEMEDGQKRHFEFDYTNCSKYNLNYKKFVEKEISERGIDSDFVKMNYRLIWLLERGQFVTEDMLFGKGEWYQKGLLDPSISLLDVEHNSTCYAGLDLGKKSDSTVLTIIKVDKKHPIITSEGTYYRKVLVNWLELLGDNYESQYWQIIEFLKRYNVDVMCIDATSQGDPIADRYSANLQSVHVEPICASQKMNSEMFKMALQEIQAGRLKIPYDIISRENPNFKKFVHQLLDVEKEYKNQYLSVKHPNIRGAHDDYVYSLALALWASQDGSLPEIEVYSNNFITQGYSPPNKIMDMPLIYVSKR